MADSLLIVAACYIGGFVVSVQTLPWVMDRRPSELDPSNGRAVLGRALKMLLLSLVWPVTMLLLRVSNGILAAHGFGRAELQAPPAGSARRRPDRPPLRADSIPSPAEPPFAPDWPRKRENPGDSKDSAPLAEPTVLAERRSRKPGPDSPAPALAEPGAGKPGVEPPVTTP